MRRPHVANAGSLRKNRRKKQMRRRPRSVSAKTAAPRDEQITMAAREPLRCVFGAVRVGALLGRVRLHLQTDRFLAVHRGDALWEEACRSAGLALAEIVARMAEREMAAALAPQPTNAPPACSAGLQPGMSLQAAGDIRTDGARTTDEEESPQGHLQTTQVGPGLHNRSHVSEGETWGTRKTGTVTLARCSAELERSMP